MLPVQVLTTSTSPFKVFTGDIPFPEYTDANIIVLVSNGKRPGKPQGGEKLGLEPAVWELTQDCWNQDREKRPDIAEVFRRFKAVVTTDLLVSPTSDLDQSSGVASISPTQRFVEWTSRNGNIQERINRLDQVSQRSTH